MMIEELPNLLQSRGSAHRFMPGSEAKSATKVAPQCLGAAQPEHEDPLKEMPRKSKDELSKEEAYWAKAQGALTEREKRERLLKFLRAHRFKDVNSSSGWFFNYWFPLHAAVEANDSEMVRLLIHFKAKTKLRDANGLTARQLARQKDIAGSHQEVLAAFKEYSAAKRKRAEARRSNYLAAAASAAASAAATLPAVSEGSIAADAEASAAGSAAATLSAISEGSIAAGTEASAASSAAATLPAVSEGSIAADTAASAASSAAATLPAVVADSIAADVAASFAASAAASAAAALPAVTEGSMAADALAAAVSDGI
eukprot:TRINITY_DN1862_c0_g1_i1.p1 TRINITY_DN1862_c0_g1~~TRINITY_DN1862_c0_g1_i1.p1  ORF type:complete len:314 (-),score=103.91 TRINITY_DN1862_c0_g1_i1:154-1095(-)